MNFFEVQVVYTRQTGEDNPCAVKESYLVESLTPSSAENRVLEELKPLISGSCDVLRIIQRKFYDYIPNSEGEHWYKAKVEMITVEDNGREARKGVIMYVQESSLKQAVKQLHFHLQNNDCELVSIAKTPILELYRDA